MKKIVLATTKNFLYRQLFSGDGYTTTEYNLPVAEGLIQEMEALQPCNVCIAEVTEDIIASNGRIFDVLPQKGKVVCLADKINAAERRFLLERGIPDVLCGARPDQLIPYMDIIDAKKSGDSGSMIILDDNNSTMKILAEIVRRFNYAPVFVASVEELFGSAINSSVRFVLVNLSARFLDLNGLVRKFYDYRNTATVPVLVYKDMREGLYVHELVSGLNRLTRFILSLDELYSFMVDILFKKEIIQHVASIKKMSDYDSLAAYGDETVNRIFFLHEKSIFNQADILDDNNYNEMIRISGKMQESLLRVMGLKWLRTESDKKDFSTAGREG
jgi:hypothetical protein